MALAINCDMGEGFGLYRCGDDAAIMPYITIANVACGFHAGDPTVMAETVALAKRHGVAVGAHPSYPDLVGFGRRAMAVSPKEAEDFCLYQIAAVAGVAQAEGLRMQHVKAHGELFNVAAKDRELAMAIARAVAAFDKSLIFFAMPRSEMLHAGQALGLRTVTEVFADRAYEPDGSLVSRRKPGAVIHDADAVVARAVRMVKDRSIVAIDGSAISVDADTICVHGDTPGSDDLAAKIRAGFEAAGITVKPIGHA
jgi:UPF0271 protein